MASALALRTQIEATLASRIPSALTPAPRTIRPVAATGIRAVDELLDGGLPLGAITEVVGAECSGRTSFALSFLAGMTQAEKVCAWIDVSDSLDPESVAAASVDMSRLLWVRCGVPPRPPRGYPLITAQNAAAAVERNALKRGRGGPQIKSRIPQARTS